MMAFICAQVFALSLWFHVASTTPNVRFLFIHSAWSLPHVCCYNVIMFSPILSPILTVLKNCTCVFNLHVNKLQAEKHSWWLKILSCWWNWKISHNPAASPEKALGIGTGMTSSPSLPFFLCLKTIGDISDKNLFPVGSGSAHPLWSDSCCVDSSPTQVPLRYTPEID